MKLSSSKLRKLIEAATVDAYNDSEQRVGFLSMIADNLCLPFATSVLGVEVVVERIDMNVGEEIVAVCRRGPTRQEVPVFDLPLPAPLPNGAEWIEA